MHSNHTLFLKGMHPVVLVQFYYFYTVKTQQLLSYIFIYTGSIRIYMIIVVVFWRYRNNKIIYYVFIYALFSDAVIISGYAASNVWMIMNHMLRKTWNDVVVSDFNSDLGTSLDKIRKTRGNLRTVSCSWFEPLDYKPEILPLSYFFIFIRLLSSTSIKN
jgi:hypothetical protein